ncbi:MAG: hypothetical protein ACK5BV_09080 [Bacteroidota bacterium]
MKRLLHVILGLIVSFQIKALDPSHFTISRITAPYFIVDGNLETTITTAYVGFEIKNTSAVTYSGLVFSIPSIGTSVSGLNYNILSPSSREVVVGSLAPNTSKTCYFYVTYPADVTPVATFNVRLRDLTVIDKTQSFNIRNRSSISANAGGIATQAFANQDALGGLIIDTVTYTVGNVRNGDETDFQVAVSNQFDPTKMELLSTAVVQSNVPGIPAGATDSLYFISGNGSAGASIKVVFRFRIKSFGFTNFLLPCAGATSGSTNYKYQLNSSLGNGSPVTVTSSANPLILKKYSDKVNYLLCEEATFRVSVKNPGTVDVSIDSLVDQLPAGFTYQSLTIASGVTTDNSVSYPSAGSTTALKYVGGVDLSSVVSYRIPAGDSIQLIYTATAPCTIGSNLSSTVRGYVGSTEFDNDQIVVNVVESLPVKWINVNAAPLGSGVKLSWKVVEDEGPFEYTVQHSQSGTGWVDIGKIISANAGLATLSYEFIHPSMYRGANLYRIVAKDPMMKLNISRVVALNNNNNDKKIRLLSNPVADNVIRFIANESGFINLMNSSGNVIWSGFISSGYNQISSPNIIKGIYWLRSGKNQEVITVQ